MLIGGFYSAVLYKKYLNQKLDNIIFDEKKFWINF